MVGDDAAKQRQVPQEQAVLVLNGPGMGRGDDRLGLMLLANFLRLLGEREAPGVSAAVLYNDAVKLLKADSPVAAHLQKLQEKGVDVIACRTCVEYFGLEGQLVLGRLGTMGGIQQLMLENRTIQP